MFVYEASVVREVLRRAEAGQHPSRVAIELGITYRTVRRWVSGETPRRRPGRYRSGPSRPPDLSTVAGAAYAYLLGLYLGDGCLSRLPRTWLLRLTLDQRYPAIIARASVAIRAVKGRGAVGLVPRTGCFDVSSYWKHWPLLLPQHGVGPKHARLIALQPWQAAITSAHPTELVRGLIDSDGCRHIARQRGPSKVYVYFRYCFSNRSDDIRRIFCDHLDLLGIGWTRASDHQITIARRSEVAKLDAFIGPKR